MAPGELQQKLPTHKYPFLKDAHVSIDEIRNRVYHGTLGVVPVRQSQTFEDLNFMMKGRSVPLADHRNLMEYDEGIENMMENYDDSEMKIHANLNTPATYHENENSFRYGSGGPSSPRYADVEEENGEEILGIDQLAPTSRLKPPAILPQTGTASTAKMAERPRPTKKVSFKFQIGYVHTLLV